VTQSDKFQGVFVYIVSPGYLKAIGMRLIRGRDISWVDAPKSEKVVIINETVARGNCGRGKTRLAVWQKRAAVMMRA